MTACHNHAARRAGMTLIEILLVLMILLLLSSVMVFNYTQLAQGGALEAGAQQLATALRHARAEAANTGRRVRIEVVAEQGESAANDAGPGAQAESSRGAMRITWEPDPLAEPGRFVTLDGPAWTRGLPTDLIAIERADRPDAQPPRVEPRAVLDAVDEPEPTFAHATFYPDGSSDAVRYIVASRRGQDTRRALVEADGLAGVVRWRLLGPDELAAVRAGETLEDGIEADDDDDAR